MPSDFVHLHVHTEYSLLDGQSQIDALMKRAKELDQTAMAITDHGVMFGVIDFYRAAKAANIKPIIGMEAYLAPRTMTDRDPVQDKRPFHLLLLARNAEGYRNLCYLASEAQLRGYYYRPRIDRDLLRQHSAGIIATTGCLAAEIPRYVEDGMEDKAIAALDWYYETFGEGNFYLELQNHDIQQLGVLNQWLYEYRKSRRTSLKLLATNDVHYVRQDDWDTHDTLLCIQTSAQKAEQNRMTLEPFGSYYLKSSEEMRREFKGAPDDLITEAFASTLEVAEMCDLNLDDKTYHLPNFPVPEGYDSTTYLRFLCEMGMGWRYPGREHDPMLRQRLDHELKIIDNMGFNTYFLIVWDLCEFARSADIWWNVRGSGAGSLVAYSLGITGIDPIQNSLLFERFLNPGRISMPDIDLDYPDNQRGQMIAYVAEKYGEERVAAIITFGTMGAKASVKDVGRALGVDLAKTNRAAAMIPTEAKQKPLQEYVDANPELKVYYENDPDIKRVVDTAMALQGMTRHVSMHAAGVIIADKPLNEYLPLHKITGNSDASEGSLKQVTQFGMETAESIGLLKVDFLGLSTLAILRKACELVEQHRSLEYAMETIPYRHDDPRLTPEQIEMLDKTFEMLGRGETIGVFQLESTGMQQMLRGMRPFKFEHIIAAVSLYRPGPMDFIPTFNKRMHGQEEVKYLHPKLESILSETYAIIVYQEQLMQIASDLFGYNLGEADLMRRAVSKKKEKDLKEHKGIFKERGPALGVDEETAEKIFDEIEFFANYGFNKCVVGSTAIVDAITGRIVTVEDLYYHKTSIEHTLTLNTGKLHLQAGAVTDVMFNGVKPVFRLTTQTGRQIEATVNHPFYTFDGWRNLGDLQAGDRLALPRQICTQAAAYLADDEISAIASGLVNGELAAIPDEIFAASNEVLIQFIDTFWRHNGEIVADNGYIVRCEMASERVARQLQHLLLRLGINAALSISAEPCAALVVLPASTPDFMRLLPALADEKLCHLCAELRAQYNAEMLAHTDKFIEADVYWDAIALIEYIGEQPTYDLTIADTHNFVANDIIVHNSHATDYAWVTLQTAFLKCHYPEEFMTALLCVQFNDSAKVATFLEECRRLQIPVLPPSVNSSMVDFDIETLEDGRRGIRFGMGAIKHVGVGVVQYLIEQRSKDGSFTTLEDFLHRVDMRQVGKRALESLVKVGALSGLHSERDELMENLERLTSYSTDYHKAQEVGQRSLFGGDTGISEKLELPPAKKAVPQREQLGWEKELLGLYVTGRPVDRVKDKLRHAHLNIIHDMKQTLEDDDEILRRQWSDKPVRVAGEVVSMKKLTTKNSETMVIFQLEDWHDTAATIEVVMFPRTWHKVNGYFRDDRQREFAPGEIVLVDGTFDTSRESAQIIANRVDQDFEFVSGDEQEEISPYAYLTAASAPIIMYDDDGNPMLPEEPPVWDAVNGQAVPAKNGHNGNGNGQHGNTAGNPFDLFSDDKKAAVPLRHIQVYMPRSSDTDKDRRRLRRLHGIFTQYPGQDTFAVVIEGPGQKVITMNFPAHTTKYCRELLDELAAEVGEGGLVIR